MPQPVRWFKIDGYDDIEYEYYTIERVIRELQGYLAHEGFLTGTPDGKLGALTMRAFIVWLMGEISSYGAAARVPSALLRAEAAIREGRVRPGQRLPLAVWSLMASIGLQEIFDGHGAYPTRDPYPTALSGQGPRTWIVRGQVVPTYRGRVAPTMPASWRPSGQTDDDERAPTLSTDPSNTEEMAVVAPTRNVVGGGSSIQPASPSFFVKHQTPILVGGAVLLVGGLAYLAYARSEAR